MAVWRGQGHTKVSPLRTMDVLTAIRAYVTKAVKQANGMKVLLLDDETVRAQKRALVFREPVLFVSLCGFSCL